MTKMQACAAFRRLCARRLFSGLTVGISFATLFVGSATAGILSTDLQHMGHSGAIDVIIQFTAPPNTSDFQAVAQAGGILKHEFTRIRGGLFTVPAAALQGLAANPRVRYVSPDR
jgi:hypothetical protein